MGPGLVFCQSPDRVPRLLLGWSARRQRNGKPGVTHSTTTRNLFSEQPSPFQ